MIYRLQESGAGKNPGIQIRRSARSAAYQLMYTAVGLVAFIVVLAVIREPRVLQRYTYTLGTLGLIVLAIPAVLPDRFSYSTEPRSGSRSAASRSSRASSPGSRSPYSSRVTWSGSGTCYRWPVAG